MLATVAALQLVVLTQVPPPPKEVTPDEATTGALVAQNAPGGRDAGDLPPPERPRAAAAPATPRQYSLLSAEPLRGGSALLAWAGWPSLGAMYAMGFTDRDDAGIFAEHDWRTSENRLGLLYRRPLGTAGGFDMAGRISAAWYVNFGADYVHDSNHSDRGVEVVPGLALSRRGGGGIFSGLAEAPMTVTTKYGAGFLFSPRASLAYEALLYPQVAIGARVGAGYRAGSGDAPLKEGRGELQFLLLGTYQLL
jgi:hypothetical protein